MLATATTGHRRVAAGRERRPVRGHQRVISHADDPAARIPVRVAEAVELLEVDVPDAGLLAQFPECRVLEGFAVQDEPAGEGPPPSNGGPRAGSAARAARLADGEDAPGRPPPGRCLHATPPPGHEHRALLRRAHARDRPAREVKEILLHAVPEDHAARRHLRLEHQLSPCSSRPATMAAEECRLTNGSRTAYRSLPSSQSRRKP